MGDIFALATLRANRHLKRRGRVPEIRAHPDRPLSEPGASAAQDGEYAAFAPPCVRALLGECRCALVLARSAEDANGREGDDGGKRWN